MVQRQQESPAGEFVVCVSILTPEPQGHAIVTSEKEHYQTAVHPTQFNSIQFNFNFSLSLYEMDCFLF